MVSPSADRGQGRTGAARPRPEPGAAPPQGNPWNALWAMMVGFFMILVDATIVAVANPSIMAKLGADYDAVIWVTSAYLLAYAVPLLVAGRLGDRFGPKNLYLVGLAVFTAASLWCGLAGSITMLIAARVVQGIGAALLTPQTLSTITRTFPAERRGVAMSVWGATAGVATLVGPLAGGVLVDQLGWQWIFFVNVPIGLIGLGLAVWLVPALPTTVHRFDVLGVVLSGLGMFLVVFGLQEGQSHHWAWWIWAVIVAGVAIFAGFVYWQAVNPREPLVPLGIFRDRNFSLSNLGIATIGFVVTGMILPVMFYAQAVCGLTPTDSALLTAPMAIASGVLAPVVGRIVDRTHPTPIVGFGFSALAVSLTWLSIEMAPDTPIWRLVLPFVGMGVGMAFIWSPLAATATRGLAPHLAGAGSGVYNATRQVGSVLGSAGMAAFMTSRISAELPATPGGAPQAEGAVSALPSFLHPPFAAAMSQSLLLPAFVALFGVLGATFLLGSRDNDRSRDRDRARRPSPEARPAEAEALTDVMATAPAGAPAGGILDDDEYLEYTVDWDDPATDHDDRDRQPAADDSVTEPLVAATGHPLPAPADDPWRRVLDELLPEPPSRPAAEPVGFAHNGFHLDDTPADTPAGRHARADADDRPGGRHAR
jgi:EmrB/QacA subfamily drug resistance transporter